MIRGVLLCSAIVCLWGGRTLSAEDPGSIWGQGEVPVLTSEEAVPQTLAEVWKDYDEHYDEYNPLDVEVLKEWEKDGIVVQLVRFTVGTFRGEKVILAGYYAYPKGGENLPAILQINGGGQKARVGGPLEWAGHGYAVFNPNNGAQEWDFDLAGLPNTEWGPLLRKKMPKKRGGPPGALLPFPFTIDDVISPRNYERFPRVLAGRRAITFLQSRPEVNPEKIGLRGHSTGGVQAVLISVDPRLKAVVPSVGGTGHWGDAEEYIVGNLRGYGGMTGEQLDLFMRTCSEEVHWASMHAPVLFLGAANDFNSPLINLVKALKQAPVEDKQMVMAPNCNHRFPPEVGVAGLMWFEDHLKGTFEFPAAAAATMVLDTEDGIPMCEVIPAAADVPLDRVEIYYSYGRSPRDRFWSRPEVVQKGDRWVAKCPVYDNTEPLFVFANAFYKIREALPDDPRYDEGFEELAVASNILYTWPDALQAAGVKSQKTHYRLIDDFSKGLQDWDGDPNAPQRWRLSTGKLSDPRWMGPKGGELVIDVNCPAAGSLLGATITRANRSQNCGNAAYITFIELPKQGWNTVRLKPNDFVNVYGEALDDWHKIINISFTNPEAVLKGMKGLLARAGDKAVAGNMPSEVTPWDSSYYSRTAESPESKARGIKRFRHVRWEGGEYVPRPKFHEND